VTSLEVERRPRFRDVSAGIDDADVHVHAAEIPNHETPSLLEFRACRSIVSDVAGADRRLGVPHAAGGPLLLPEQGRILVQAAAVRASRCAAPSFIVVSQEDCAVALQTFAPGSGKPRADCISSGFVFATGLAAPPMRPHAAVLTLWGPIAVYVSVLIYPEETPRAGQILLVPALLGRRWGRVRSQCLHQTRRRRFSVAAPSIADRTSAGWGPRRGVQPHRNAPPREPYHRGEVAPSQRGRVARVQRTVRTILTDASAVGR
jgi:hypothetical protein